MRKLVDIDGELVLVKEVDRVTEVEPSMFRESAAAKYVGLRVNTFREYVHAGRIRARKLGVRRRYLKKDLDAFMDSLPVDMTAIKNGSQGGKE